MNHYNNRHSGYRMASNSNYDNSANENDNERNYSHQYYAAGYAQAGSSLQYAQVNPGGGQYVVTSSTPLPPGVQQLSWNHQPPATYGAGGHGPGIASGYGHPVNVGSSAYVNASGAGFAANGIAYPPSNGLPLLAPGGMATAGVLQSPHIVGSHSVESTMGTFTCPHCGKSYDRKSRWESHLNTHLDVRLYRCDGSCGTTNCDVSFTSAEALGAHKKKDREVCKKCGHLVTKKNMSRHLNTHCGGLYQGAE
ncbi:hypothetical protein PIIN_04171 [Serendipita indica DSM 11827]|uniref:C2H2-type domain-containing protein n=1 Tax=Serendipita indica (strain DSM 11827) TaxID=1109443 RepID=G4TG04_SERID|nr:hypothetical protein PIIN_04171 [Serendipita indica DSM 11827]